MLNALALPPLASYHRAIREMFSDEVDRPPLARRILPRILTPFLR